MAVLEAIFSFIIEMAVYVFFDVIIEPAGAFVRYWLFRLRGKKVDFVDLMPESDEENILNNAFTNRIIGGVFLFIVIVPLIVLIVFLST